MEEQELNKSGRQAVGPRILEVINNMKIEGFEVSDNLAQKIAESISVGKENVEELAAQFQETLNDLKLPPRG